MLMYRSHKYIKEVNNFLLRVFTAKSTFAQHKRAFRIRFDGNHDKAQIMWQIHLKQKRTKLFIFCLRLDGVISRQVCREYKLK